MSVISKVYKYASYSLLLQENHHHYHFVENTLASLNIYTCISTGAYSCRCMDIQYK